VNTFLNDLGSAAVNVPAEIARWWREGHTRTEWLYAWEDGDHADPGARHLFAISDTDPLNSYKLWRLLGRVSDALLLTIAALVVLLLILAIVG
jgi:hypothetical protein